LDPEEGTSNKLLLDQYDTLSVKSKIKDKDLSEVEHWLNKQNGTVMIQVFTYKIILALCFNKKRPSMIPNFIIPSEYEMLDALKNAVAGLEL
jgi:hypothetical protein